MAAKKPATKKPAKKTAVSLEALQEVAIDFNSFMFDEGKGLKFEHLEYDDLLAELTEAAEDLVAEDTVTAETANTLKVLGIECPAGVSEAEEADEADDADADADDEEEDNDDTDNQDEESADEQEEVDNSEAIALAEAGIVKVKKTKKLEDLRAIAKENGINIPPPFLKDLAKMKDYLAKKLSAIAAGEIPAKKAKIAKPKKEKKEKKPFVMDALREIMCADETISLEELKKQITAQGFVVTDRTVYSVHTDTGKIIACLKANGRLKK